MYFVACERALSGRVWIKNLFFELFPMICIFSWWIKSLIPKNFWYGSRMTMRKIEILLLAKVELIVYIPFHIHESVLQLFWEHLFWCGLRTSTFSWSCRFSGTKYNHVPKMNASHHYGNWSLTKEENECTIEGITPHWVRQAFDLAAFDFVKLKAFLTRLGVIPTMVTWLTS